MSDSTPFQALILGGNPHYVLSPPPPLGSMVVLCSATPPSAEGAEGTMINDCGRVLKEEALFLFLKEGC